MTSLASVVGAPGPASGPADQAPLRGAGGSPLASPLARRSRVHNMLRGLGNAPPPPPHDPALCLLSMSTVQYVRPGRGMGARNGRSARH